MGKSRNVTSFVPLAGLVACLFVAAGVPAGAGDQESRQPAWVEPDVDRPGSDFKILWLRGGLEACQEACAQNPVCKSYTYVRGDISGRIEGCWLKDAVPAPVRDGCCVSGVKTGETVSRFLRDAVTMPREAEGPPSPSGEPKVAPAPLGTEPEIREEQVPETGSGKRAVARLDFAAMPPERIAGKMRNGISAAILPPVAYVGTGRRQTKGMDYEAMPPGMAALPVPEPVHRAIRETGTGWRMIRGVTYAAAPPPGRKAYPGGPRAKAVMRQVPGVDFTAVPPQP